MSIQKIQAYQSQADLLTVHKPLGIILNDNCILLLIVLSLTFSLEQAPSWNFTASESLVYNLHMEGKWDFVFIRDIQDGAEMEADRTLPNSEADLQIAHT